jgi:hypothetical protein
MVEVPAWLFTGDLQPCSQERGKRTITAKITYNGHYMLDVL